MNSSLLLSESVLVAGLLLCCGRAAMAADAEVNVTVHGDRLVNRVDERIYGQFFEHIYHSANGGLWGDAVWNRSFETLSAAQTAWKADGEELAQLAGGTPARLTFGQDDWSDYEFSLEAMKTGGAEGFLILCRASGPDAYYWANLGGWGNTAHGLERGAAGGTREAVGPRVSGSIEANRWYAIKVRCEGSKLTLWLDGKQVLEALDQANAKGGVGVGTWATEARFRNLKVTSLDGRALHEGLPALPTAASPWESWIPYGTGEVKLTDQEPLNGRYAAEIIGEQLECGLAQRHFAIAAGETYSGSIWARGKADGIGLSVRLVGRDGMVDECPIKLQGEEWREYPVTLKGAYPWPEGLIQITLRGPGHVFVDQLSLMPGACKANGGFRPDLLAAMAALKPPFIRWPGGCYAEWYRWKDGVGPQHKRGKFAIRMWDDEDVNSLGTDEFLDLCRRIGCEPLIVINAGRHDPAAGREAYLREACEWIEYCNGPADSPMGKLRAANGHSEPYNVRYWEIDNETWAVGPAEYCNILRAFIPAMKKVDPRIIVSVCGSAGFDDGGATNGWNAHVIRECADLFDTISIHHYENPDLYEQGPRNYEAFVRKTGEQIAASKNPCASVFVSEWNAQSTDWRTGLYCGGLLNAFERTGNIVTMASPALFLRHHSAREWDNAFINFDQHRWFPAPNYVVMKLWREHYKPVGLGVDGDTGPLNLAASGGGGKGLVLKVVNPSQQAVRLKATFAGGGGLSKAAMQIIAPGSLTARNTLDRPDAIKPATHPVSVEGRVVTTMLPPWSAGVIVVE